MEHSENGWNEYQRLVLHELERLSDSIADLAKSQADQNIAIEGLKLKSSFIATISGFIAAVGFDLTKTFFNK